MADPAWTPAEVAHALCDSLVAAGRSEASRTAKLRSSLRPPSDVPHRDRYAQASIRKNREAEIAGIFE